MKHLFLKTLFSLAGLGLLTPPDARAQIDEATASPLVLGDSVRCQSGTTVQVSFGGLATSGSFGDGGAGGTFTDVQTVGNTVSAFYNPPADYDTLVVLTFTTNDPEGPAEPASSSARFWVVKPIKMGPVVFSKNPICLSDTVSLKAFSYLPKYKWLEAEIRIRASEEVEGKLVAEPPGRGFSAINAFIKEPINKAGTYYLTFGLRSKNACPNDADSSTGILHVVSPGPTVVKGVSATVCAGQALALTAEGGCPGTMTAQLSNASGSFASPVVLGTATIGPNSLLIPAGTPAGTGYRVRLVKDNVVLANSGAFRVNGPGSALVALFPSTPTRLCLGDELPVTFSTTGACPFPAENVFTVQLSSSTGSFAAPLTLGTATPGTTSLVLPQNLPAGMGYRVRILSSLPAQTSQPSLPFELRFPNVAGLTPGVDGVPQGGICRGNAVTLSFSLPAGSCAFPGGNGFTAQLSSSTGSFANPVSLGTVQAGVPNSLTIPANSAAGTGYRIRVLSSQPASTSLASIPFRVNACNARLSAEEAELVVAPNPVKGGNAFPGEIRVRVSGMDSPAFTLTGSTGRSVGLSVQPDGSGEFVLTPRQALAPGVYAVQASEGTTRLTRRVLVVE